VNYLKKYTNLENGVSQLSEFFLTFYNEWNTLLSGPWCYRRTPYKKL